ncbi:FkbM family methyltransferase [Candidatus Peregrinibacteria bacterium]|nr:FkbM family methyltransferase [Candidatus Peregrinibacteria bacterium]
MVERNINIFGKTVHLAMRNDGDYAIAGELFLEHQYRFCDEAIKRAGDAVIDIGGHLGFFSLYASLLNPKVPIYAFEPHIGNFEILKMNLRNNGVKNVTAKQMAVGKQVGQTLLHLSREDLNHSTVMAIEPTGETQPVAMTTLARIFEKNRIEKCDLIKMDCEGAEFEILHNTPQRIFDKAGALFIEYHDWVKGGSGKKLKDFLILSGFKTQQFSNNKMKELGFLWCTR